VAAQIVRFENRLIVEGRFLDVIPPDEFYS